MKNIDIPTYIFSKDGKFIARMSKEASGKLKYLSYYVYFYFYF